MNYVIPGGHIKVIARAVNALSKIGDEVFVNPLPDGLSLKTLNSAKSSYGSFKFKKTFFSHHTFVSKAQSDQLSCKILMKSVCAVFKLSQALEKYVERCEIKMAEGDDTITFRLYCRYGNFKTYNISIIESDALESYNDEERTANYISTSAKIFNDAMQNFLASQDDITLVISQDAIKIKNYVQDEPDVFKAVHTELFLYKHEFESYNVTDEGEITFCLKEFRAFLTFCDHMKISVSARFDGSGKPVMFSSELFDKLQSLFVLSTMDSRDGFEECAPSRLGTSQIISNPVTPTSSQDERSLGRVRSQRSSLISSAASPHNTVLDTDRSGRSNGDNNISFRATENNLNNSLKSIARISGISNTSDRPSSPVPRTHLPDSGNIQGLESNSVTQPSVSDFFSISGDVIPGSPPPAKKIKHIFQRCFDLTVIPSELPGCSQVMAEDSDEGG